MLIITRKPTRDQGIGSTLYIGDDIQVTILGVKGNQVRVGIGAPKNVPVVRDDVKHRPESGRD